MAKVSGSTTSKAAQIRVLAARGTPRKDIARQLEVSENHVTSSLSRDRGLGKIPAIPRSGMVEGLVVNRDGGVTLSPSTLQMIGLAAGDEAVLVVTKAEILIMSPSTALQKLST
jgi:hypothetical protein